ncbi:MAG: hypothetical protein PHS19_00830 [Eubacteriales bacterium]|nr:hypothetical protein [Eubacteriales bacterium]
MVGKLIKVEFKSSFRMLLVVWVALLAMTIIMCLLGSFTGIGQAFVDPYMGAPSAGETIVAVVSWILYIGLFAAVVVLTIAVIILRFYKGLLGDEGYLMHTLPVKEWQLITAKGIVAACAVIGSGIVVCISMMFIMGVGDLSMMLSSIKGMFEAIGETPSLILIGFEGLILMVMGILKSIYQVYAAISIGQLFNRHRILTSLGAYIGITIVLSIIVGAATVIMDMIGANSFLIGWLNSISLITADGISVAAQIGFLAIFLITAVQLVAFHIISERLLTKRLNLL